MREMHHFPKFSYVSANFRVDLNLDRFSEQFQNAQQLLGEMVLHDCKAVMPHLTGDLQQRSRVENGGRRVIFPGPYGRFLYGGKVMIDPVTGSPRARKGVKKVLTDRPLRFSNPAATDHWFDEAKARHCEYWLARVKEIAGGGK